VGKVTDATMKPRIVRVDRERGKAGLFYATSPDLRGLLVAEPTPEALDEAIPKAIRDLYVACGVEVIVSIADDSHDDREMWVAFPAAIARAALSRSASF
jgi:hypothetical protein